MIQTESITIKDVKTGKIIFVDCMNARKMLAFIIHQASLDEKPDGDGSSIDQYAHFDNPNAAFAARKLLNELGLI